MSDNTQARTLSTQLQERGISNGAWHTLSKSLYPGARTESILLVIDYCKARGLDPMKKPAHIVPMEVRDAKSGDYQWQDVVLPGIYELRTTAQRTGEYMGHSKPEYGPDIEFKSVKAPEYCSFTVYRWNQKAQMKGEYPVTVYFTETVGLKKGGAVNSRWSKAPRQMLTKCAEAAALREAFPDELGGQMTHEEMEGVHASQPAHTTNGHTVDDLNAELGLQDEPIEGEATEVTEPE